MANAGTLSVEVQAKVADVLDKFSQLETRADRFAAKLSKTGNADYFAPVQESLKGMGRDFKQIIQGIVLAQTFYQGIQLFKKLTAAVYEYTDALDYAKVTFSNLFRDASLGEEFVAVLQQYASRTPFDFSDVENGARKLAAYGIEAKNLMYVMQGIGNLSAVTGNPETFDRVATAIGQINSRGKLSAEEMRQLAEAGLNVKKVYARLGVESGNLAKANIDSATAINAIIETLNTDYAGAMEASNQTMRGMIGNVKDTLLSVSSAVFNPLYKRMQGMLKGFQEGLSRFQKTFTDKGLADAIEEAFGPDVLMRIQQFLAIAQMLGAQVYQLLIPAFKLLAIYGASTAQVFGLLIQIIGPVISYLSQLLNALLQNARALRVVQGLMLAMVAAKVANAFVALLSGTIGILSRGLSKLIAGLTVAYRSMGVFAASMRGGASATTAAATAMHFFNGRLKVNPIVIIISAVLGLITAFVGLRAVLGQTSDELTALSGLDPFKYLRDIKQDTGDLDKFNNALDGTSSGVDDINDALEDTKKTQKDLLSFDEVFRLPEYENDDDPVIPDLGDLGSFELPEVEPIDLSKLFPDAADLKKFFEDLDLGDGLASALATAFHNLNTNGWFKNLGTKISQALGRVVKRFRGAASFVKGLGSKVGSAFKTFKFGPKAGQYLSEELGETVKKPFKNYKVKPGTIKPLNSAATEGMAKFKFGPKAGQYIEGHLGETLESSFKKVKLPGTAVEEMAATVEETVTEQIARRAWPKISAGSLFKGFIAALKEGLKAGLLAIALDFVFDILIDKLKEAGLSGAARFGENFGTILASGIATKIVTKSTWAAIGAMCIQAIFDSVEESQETGDWSGSIEAVVTGLAALITSHFAKKKGGKGGKLAGFAIIGGLLVDAIFGSISDELDENGDKKSADMWDKAGTIISTAIDGAAMGAMIGGPWGAAIGAALGALIGEFIAFSDDIKVWGETKLLPALQSVGNFFQTAFNDIPNILTGVAKIVFGLLTGDTESITAGMEAIKPAAERMYWAFAQAMYDIYNVATPFFKTIAPLFGQSADEIDESMRNLKLQLDWHTHGMGQSFEEWTNSVRNNAIHQTVALQTATDEQGNILALQEENYATLKGSVEQSLSGVATATESNMGQISQVMQLTTKESSASFEQFSRTVELSSENIPTALDGVREGFALTKEKLQEYLGGSAKLTDDEFSKIVEVINSTKGTTEEKLAAFNNAFSGSKLSVSNSLAEMRTEMRNKYGDITMDTGKLPGDIKASIENNGGNKGLLQGIGEAIIGGLKVGLDDAWKGVQDFIRGIAPWIFESKGPVEKDRELLVPAGTAIMEGFDDSLQKRYSDVQTFFTNIGGTVQGYFNNAVDWLKTAGGNIIEGLHDGIDWAFDRVEQLMNGMQDQIQGPFSDAVNWLSTAGKDVINGLKSGLDTGESMIRDFANTVHGKIEEIGTAITNGLKTALDEGYKRLEEFISGAKSKIESLAADIKKGLEDAFSKGMQFVNGFFDSMKSKITSGFQGSGEWLKPQGEKISAGLCDGMKQGIDKAQTIATSIKSSIVNKFTGSESWLLQPGSKIIQGLCSGMEKGTNQVNAVAQKVRSAIQQAFSSVASWATQSGQQVMTGLVNGMQAGVGKVQSLLSTLQTSFKNSYQQITTLSTESGRAAASAYIDGYSSYLSRAISPLDNLLATFKKYYQQITSESKNAGTQAGTQFITGYKTAVVSTDSMLRQLLDIFKSAYNQIVSQSQQSGNQAAQGFMSGLNNMPNMVNNVLSNVRNMFQNAMQSIMQIATQSGQQTMYAYSNGLQSGANNAISIVYNMTSTIANAFSNTGNLLYNAGASIMMGLREGLVQTFNNQIIPTVSLMASIIAKNKGPESYDRKLLVPNGNWIMEGLDDGLIQRFKGVINTVRSFGPAMENAFEMPALSVGRMNAPVMAVAQQQPVQQAAVYNSASVMPTAPATTEPDNRPILYVGTLIADKQGLRELSRKLDMVSAESDRWK